jgi:hypothetical protein
MFRRRTLLASVVLSVCSVIAVTTADAQLTNLIPGVRARVRAPGIINGRVTGLVTVRSADSLALTMENGVPVRLPLAAITAADVSQGRSRSRGAMKGALWGAGAGALSSLFSDIGDENCTGDACISQGEFVVASVVSFALVGALIGSFVQSEQWVPVQIPIRAAFLPSRGGATAVVSIRF